MPNISVAIAVGKYFDVPSECIKEATEAYVPENNRSQLIKKGTNEIILDAYHANPSSMEASISTFLNFCSNRKIMILGDMFELGSDSMPGHNKIVDSLIAVKGIDFYFVGNYFYENKIQKKTFFCSKHLKTSSVFCI